MSEFRNHAQNVYLTFILNRLTPMKRKQEGHQNLYGSQHGSQEDMSGGRKARVVRSKGNSVASVGKYHPILTLFKPALTSLSIGTVDRGSTQ